MIHMLTSLVADMLTFTCWPHPGANMSTCHRRGEKPHKATTNMLKDLTSSTTTGTGHHSPGGSGTCCVGLMAIGHCTLRIRCHMAVFWSSFLGDHESWYFNKVTLLLWKENRRTQLWSRLVGFPNQLWSSNKPIQLGCENPENRIRRWTEAEGQFKVEPGKFDWYHLHLSGS